MEQPHKSRKSLFRSQKWLEMANVVFGVLVLFTKYVLFMRFSMGLSLCYVYIYICMVLLSYEPLNDLIFALRSILAAQCIEGFRSVPRTYHSHFCHSSPMHTHIHICATLPSVTTSLESQLPYKSPLLYVTTSRSRHLPKSPLHRVSLFVVNSEDCFLASFDIYIYIYICIYI